MPPNWQERAACRNAPIEIFITSSDDEPYYPSRRALEYCDRCCVKPECLQYATDNKEIGTWGGTTAYQRRQLERDRERVHCPGCGSIDLIFENTVELCLACGISWHIV